MESEGNLNNRYEITGTINFESTELCALDSAFENPANNKILEKIREKFPETYTNEETKFFKDSTRMSTNVKTFGNFFEEAIGIIEAETDNLSEKPDLALLPCGHRVAEHKLALKKARAKILAL